jgi:hypothetical protein
MAEQVVEKSRLLLFFRKEPELQQNNCYLLWRAVLPHW